MGMEQSNKEKSNDTERRHLLSDTLSSWKRKSIHMGGSLKTKKPAKTDNMSDC
jgi:hypothetical protein